MSVGDDNSLVFRGAWGAVRYATQANGKMLADEFIGDLDDSDQRKLGALFERMAEHGQIRNEVKFKKVFGHIFEFKSFQIRIGCFQVGRTWFLTHGFVKKQAKWPKPEIERARRIQMEHLQR